MDGNSSSMVERWADWFQFSVSYFRLRMMRRWSRPAHRFLMLPPDPTCLFRLPHEALFEAAPRGTDPVHQQLSRTIDTLS